MQSGKGDAEMVLARAVVLAAAPVSGNQRRKMSRFLYFNPRCLRQLVDANIYKEDW